MGFSSPNHSDDGTAGRVISRIARHAQIGETSQLGSFSDSGGVVVLVDYEQQWLPPGAERPARPKKMISSPKVMIITFGSPVGFSVIHTLLPKVIFTSECFVDAILLHIVAAKSAGDPNRRLVLHMDNASPRREKLATGKLEENGMTASPHPAFSPKLGSSNFFLFGALKGQLSGRMFESLDELIEAIGEIALTDDTGDSISPMGKRVNGWLDINDAYIGPSLRWNNLLSQFLTSRLSARRADSPGLSCKLENDEVFIF